MNELNILLAANKDFKFVTCIFAPFTGHNRYTHKTLLDIKEEDFLVVDTPSKGLQVVQVRKVLTPLEVDLEVKFEYKWVVQKLDLEHYNKVETMEKEVRRAVNTSKNSRALADARRAMGIDAVTIAKLTKL